MEENIRNTAIQYGVPCFTRKENIKAVIQSLVGQDNNDLVPFSLQEIHQIKKNNKSEIRDQEKVGKHDKQDDSRIR